jgi:hypothetical protein
MLYTLRTGEITSKSAAHWGLATLDLPWSGLIERADAWRTDHVSDDSVRAPELSLFPFIHIRHLVHLTLLVVCNPLPDLFASLKVARPHSGAILPEPLPIAVHFAIYDRTSAFYAAVFVVLNVFV